MILVSNKAYENLKKKLSQEDLSKLIPVDEFSLTTTDVCKAVHVSKMTLLKRIDELEEKGYAFKCGKGARTPWRFKKDVVEYLGSIPDGRGAHWAEKRKAKEKK
jgi:DeoR/GlpR family transcriptional regulator of sugar metabolism